MTSRPTWAPTAEDLIELNKLVTQPEYGGGWHAIVYESGIYSAAERPWGCYFGVEVFPTPYDKAAALMHSIIKSHCFEHGNKRTAFAAGAQLLRKMLPGQKLRSTTQDNIEVGLAVAEDRMSLEELAAWLEANSAS